MVLCWAAGSSRHTPSATNRYSWRPGSSETLKYHTPSLPLYMGMVSGSQLLKSPANETFRAFGAWKAKGTVVCRAALSSDDFVFTYQSFSRFGLWTPTSAQRITPPV